MINIDRDLLVKELGYMTTEFRVNNSKDMIKKNFGSFHLLNDVLGDLIGLKYPLSAVFSDPKGINVQLRKINSKKLEDFAKNSSNNLDVLTSTLANYSSFLEKIDYIEFPYAIRNYNQNDFIDICLGYFSTYGNDIYKIVKKYFDEKRIEFGYRKKDKDVGGFFTYINHLCVGYIMMCSARFNTLTLISLAHELGHAIDAELFIFPQQKKINHFSDMFLEVPSATFELGFDNYCIKNGVDPIGGSSLFNTRVDQVDGYFQLLKSAMNEEDGIITDSGDLYVDQYEFIKKEDAVLDENNKILVNSDGFFIDKAYIDNNGDYHVHKYRKYQYRDYIIYSIGYLFAMYLNEIKENVSLNEYLKILGNIMTLRKDNNIEEMVKYMGLGLDDFISCDLIKDRIMENDLLLRKRFNVYY